MKTQKRNRCALTALVAALCLSVLAFFALSVFPTTTAEASHSSIGTNTVDEWNGTQESDNLINIGGDSTKSDGYELTSLGWNLGEQSNQIYSKARWYDNVGLDTPEYGWGIQAKGSSDDIGLKDFTKGVWYPITLSDADRVKANKGDLKVYAEAIYYRQNIAFCTHYISLKIFFLDADGKQLAVKEVTHTIDQSAYTLRVLGYNVPANTASMRYYVSNWGTHTARPFIGGMQCWLVDKTAPAAKDITLDKSGITDVANSVAIAGDTVKYIVDFDEKISVDSYGTAKLAIDGTNANITGAGSLVTENGASKIIYTFTLPELAKSGKLSLYSVSGLTIKDEAGNTLTYNNSSPASGMVTFYKTMSVTSKLGKLTFTGNAKAVYGTDYSATITAATGYNLPSAVTVKIGGTAASGSAYTYNKATGKITIKGSQIKGDIIVEANGVAKQTTITLDRNGGAGGSASVTATYDQDLPLINIPSLKGYTFLGYYTAGNGGKQYYNGNGQGVAGCDFYSPITLYAHWKANEYSVKYVGNKPANASSSLSGTMENSLFTYDENETLTDSGYTLKGYSFLGWATTANGNVVYRDGAAVKNLSETNGATITLYAVWKANTYNVRYDSNKPRNASGIIEGNTATTSHTYDKIESLGTNRYSLVGWTFLGWAKNSDATAAEFEDTVTVKNLSDEDGGIVKLYAVWKANAYTVIFNGNKPAGASTSLSGTMANVPLTYDNGENLPEVGYTLKGYTFLGWALGRDESVTFRNKATVKNLISANGGSVTLYAIWQANSYTVSFETSGGNLADSVTATFDEKLPDVTPAVRKGYNFKGYFSEINGGGTKYYNEDGTATTVKYTVNGNIALYALWSPVVYNIELYSEGVRVSTIKDVVFGMLRLPSAETLGLRRDNYTFIGWNIYDEQNWSMYNADTDYYAGLADYDGETVTLHAAWLEKDRYTINFDANGGMGAPATAQAHEGETIVLSDVIPTRNNYTFLGWATTADASTAEYLPKDEFTMGNSVVTLYAVWKLNPSLTYDPNGGKFVNSPEVLYPAAGSEITITSLIPELEGNTFDGWSFTSGATSADYRAGDKITMPSSDVVLYAVWEKTQLSATSYAADGYGITGLNSVYHHGDTVEFRVTGAKPKVFVNGQRIYEGENGLYSFIIKENTLIYVADGTKLSLIYSANGGANPPSDKNSYNADDIAEISEEKPTRTGYTFVGWARTPYADGKDYDSGSILEFTGEDVVLYAVWQANGYTVSYDPNGGAGDMTSDEFSYGTAGSLSANKYEKTGFTFIGWATSANGEAVYADLAAVYNLTSELNANITLYAIWEKTITVISFAEDGGIELNSPILVAYGDKLSSEGLVAPTRAGYFFAGYRTGANGSGELIFDENLKVVGSGIWDKNVTEITLYPSRNPISYTVVYMNGQKELGRKSAVYGVAFTLNSYASLGLTARDGYHFAGWSTIPSGHVAMFTDEQEIPEALTQTDGEAVYLYAVFAANEKYSAIYYANGGMGAPVDENEYYAGDTVTFGGKIPKLDGYVFAGWSRNPNGNIDFPYENGVFKVASTTMPEGGLTLYAIWKADPNGTLQTRIDDLKDQADKLEKALEAAKKSLESADETLTGKLTDLGNELTNINNILASLDGKYATPDDLSALETALKKLLTETENSLNESIDAVKTDLAKAKENLTDLIKGNSDNITLINTAIENLQKANADVQAYLDGDLADALKALREKDGKLGQNIADLSSALETAKTDINAAIKKVEDNLTKESERLGNLIANNSNDIEEITKAFNDFKSAYDIAKAATDSKLKDLADKDGELGQSIADLSSALETAKTDLNAAIKKVEDNLTKESERLGTLIANNSNDIEEITKAFNSFKSAYDIAKAATDSKLKDLADKDGELGQNIADLSSALETAKTDLNAAIKKVEDNLTKESERLGNLIENNSSDIEEITKAFNDFKTAYEAAQDILDGKLTALGDRDDELEASINALRNSCNAADNKLRQAINNVQKNLDKAVAEIKELISTNSNDIDKIFAAIEDLNNAYKAADVLIDNEINSLKDTSEKLAESIAALDSAYKTADDALWAAIKQLQENLDEAQKRLEEKDKNLDARIDALTAETKKITIIFTVVGIVLGVAVIALGAILTVKSVKKKNSGK